ncbi:MAG: DUF4290 domain-containing protein [Cyclobacteriaceae bacterium]|nr:DUF4290 domain-containing protein [Cyclobacteriaceae bacterium]
MINTNMFDYNTGRKHLRLREFGRNVQKLAEHLLTIEDKEKRSRYATGVVELMRQVVPSIKDNPEDTQRLWDDLHIMTKYQLDVDAPYDKPDEFLINNPEKVPYNRHNVRFKHYGHNLKLMVQEAVKMEDEAQKHDTTVHIGKLMKSYHMTWNKEIIDDEVIIKNIGIMSEGALNIDIEKVKEENLFEPLYKERIRPTSNSSSTNRNKKSSNGHKNQNRRRRP